MKIAYPLEEVIIDVKSDEFLSVSNGDRNVRATRLQIYLPHTAQFLHQNWEIQLETLNFFLAVVQQVLQVSEAKLREFEFLQAFNSFRRTRYFPLTSQYTNL